MTSRVTSTPLVLPAAQHATRTRAEKERHTPARHVLPFRSHRARGADRRATRARPRSRARLGPQRRLRGDGGRVRRAPGPRGRRARGRGGARPALRRLPLAARGHVRLLRSRVHQARAPGVPAGVRGVPLAQPRGVPQPRGRGVHRGRGQTHGGGDRGTRLRASANETRIGHGFHGLFAFSRFHDDRVLADASARRADGSGASRSGAIPHPGREPNVARWETTREDLFQSPDFFFETARAYQVFWRAQFFFLFSFLGRRRARAFDDDETDIEPNT